MALHWKCEVGVRTLDPADHGTRSPSDARHRVTSRRRSAHDGTASGRSDPREALLSFRCGLGRAILCLVRRRGDGLGGGGLRAALDRESRLADGQPGKECGGHGEGR